MDRRARLLLCGASIESLAASLALPLGAMADDGGRNKGRDDDRFLVCHATSTPSATPMTFVLVRVDRSGADQLVARGDFFAPASVMSGDDCARFAPSTPSQAAGVRVAGAVVTMDREVERENDDERADRHEEREDDAD